MTRILRLNDLSARHRSAGTIAGVILVIVVMMVIMMVHWYVTQRTEVFAKQLILQTEQAFEEVRPFTNADATSLRQFPNRIHVERAQQLGIPRLPDREAAARMLASDVMVRLEDTPHYVVLDLGYSVPYVTTDAAHLLEIIGRRFHTRLAELGLPLYRFLVTSATRTDDDQRRLRQVNANAAANSSHFHGTTVDLHYARWDYDLSHDPIPRRPGMSASLLQDRLQSAYEAMIEERHPALKSILAQVLLDAQNEGLVMVTYERMQPVYHITVNREIESPVAVPDEPLELREEDDLHDRQLTMNIVAPAR